MEFQFAGIRKPLEVCKLGSDMIFSHPNMTKTALLSIEQQQGGKQEATAMVQTREVCSGTRPVAVETMRSDWTWEIF